MPKNPEHISESTLDQYLKSLIEKKGGLYLKFEPIHLRGIPDRFIFLPPGILIIAELKATGKKPSPHQKAVHRMFKKIGFDVWIPDTKKKADEIIEHYENLLKKINYEK